MRECELVAGSAGLYVAAVWGLPGVRAQISNGQDLHERRILCAKYNNESADILVTAATSERRACLYRPQVLQPCSLASTTRSSSSTRIPEKLLIALLRKVLQQHTL
jgi:hypothetical protein